jgi:transcription termination factor Rho
MDSMADRETSPALNSIPVSGEVPGRRRASRNSGASAAKGRKSATAQPALPGSEIATSALAETPATAAQAEVVNGDVLVDPARARRGARIGRPRGARAAKLSDSPQSSDHLNAGVDEAKKSAPRVSRSRRAAGSEEAMRPIVTPERRGNMVESRGSLDVTGGLELDGGAGASPSPTFATEPYRPAARPSYRFGRSPQESGVPPEAESPSQPRSAALQPHPTERVEQHGHRPLRRAGWAPQNGQDSDAVIREPRESRPGRERVQPHVPGGADPYRARQQGQRSGGVSQSRTPGNSGGHSGQHGQVPSSPSGQPSRGSVPYSPGGRGGHAPSPTGSGHEMPYAPPSSGGPSGGTGGQNSGMPGSPYGGYEPYDPYGFSSHEQPRGSHDRTAPMGRPPLRGRGYSNQSSGGYDPRDTRGSRPSTRSPSPADYYRREQGMTNQRDTTHGSQAGRGGSFNSRGFSDRRGGSGSRGPGGRASRESREAGYPSSLYTSVQGGPTLTQSPSERSDRYEHMSTSFDGMDVMGGVRPPSPMMSAHTVEVTGILWQSGNSYGSAELLDGRTLLPVARVNAEDVRRMGLRQGDMLSARAEERAGRRQVVAIDSVNDRRPQEAFERPMFDKLTASFPERRIHLEHGAQPISTRIIDLFAPLGFGSRALVVAPPKTGKTTLMREAAEAVLAGYPSAVVMAVLVGERPEEVTDLRARLEPRGGLVYAASFDEDTQRHAWLVQVAVERAKRLAESGRDAFMVLDSLTRLARAENLSTRGQGRTLSGGIDAQALDTGRRAFGAARNLEEGGSVTILATCLVDTGSRQDDVVYEEFKGTGNMELHLSRELAQRRLFPAVDAVKSSTRREEMLLTPEELRASTALRRRLADLPTAQATQQLLSVMERTPSNAALLQAIEQSGWTGNTR